MAMTALVFNIFLSKLHWCCCGENMCFNADCFVGLQIISQIANALIVVTMENLKWSKHLMVISTFIIQTALCLTFMLIQLSVKQTICGSLVLYLLTLTCVNLARRISTVDFEEYEDTLEEIWQLKSKIAELISSGSVPAKLNLLQL